MAFNYLQSALTGIGLLFQTVSAQVIAQINRPAFLSPYQNEQTRNLTGLVTAKASTGIFLRSTTPDSIPATSESIFICSSTAGNSRAVGDVVCSNGRVSQYRSESDYLYLTELTSPPNVLLRFSGYAVTPVVRSVDLKFDWLERCQPPDGALHCT